MMQSLPEILKLIKGNKNFLIVGHVNPEGDSIGSSIALALGLRKMGKDAYVLSRDPVPGILRFLPHSDLLNTNIPPADFDVLFMVDCNTMERTGFKNLKAERIVVIDHHLHDARRTMHDARYFRWIDPTASAAGELVYKLLKALHVPIDKEIAVNLYTAIFTDTGGFRYSNTTPESLSAASELVEAGAVPWEITKEVYEKFPLNRLRLLALSLSTLERKGNMAWITVTQHMLKKTGASAQDTEDFINYPRKIKGIEVAVLFRQDGRNAYKISLRSKGKVDVANIAKTFDGGGHAKAAGCRLKGSLSEVKKMVFGAVRKVIKTQN